MKKLLLEMKFRLRNDLEYNKIKNKFIENGYEILEITEFEHKNLNYEFLLKYFLEHKLCEKYDKIVFISNIEDAILVWYRIYNFLADDFILFIDKYNYNLLKGEIFQKIAEFNSISKEKKIDKIYMNLNEENVKNIEKILKNIINIQYIEIVEKIEYNNKKNKEISNKVYILKEEKIDNNNNLDKKEIEIIILDSEKEVYNIKEIFDIFNKNKKMILFYFILNYEKYSKENDLVGFFERYFYYLREILKDKKHIDDIYEMIEKSSINFLMKCKLCTFLICCRVKDKRILKIMLSELKKEVNNTDYHFGILVNIFLFYYIDKIEGYENMYEDMRGIISNLTKEYYINIEEIENTKCVNGEEYKIAVIVDQMLNAEHSSTKATLAFAGNLMKYKNAKIKVFVEENYFNNLDNVLFREYITYSKINCEEHNKILKINGYSDVEIYYSDIYKTKKERVRETIKEILEFNPKIVINLNNICSLTMEYVSKKFNSYFLTLGGVNFQKNQIINFYSIEVEKIKKIENNNNIFLKRKMYDFKKMESCYKRDDFKIENNDMVMVSVSAIPDSDFTKEYLEIMLATLEKYEKLKWIVVGTEKISAIDSVFNKNQIIFIEYEKKLGDLYQICDIYANPPREGGGYSIVEAMFYGMPVINLRGSLAGDAWCGIENCVNNMSEYSEKIEKMVENRDYFLNQKERFLKKTEEYSAKKYFEEMFSYIDKSENIKL